MEMAILSASPLEAVFRPYSEFRISSENFARRRAANLIGMKCRFTDENLKNSVALTYVSYKSCRIHCKLSNSSGTSGPSDPTYVSREDSLADAQTIVSPKSPSSGSQDEKPFILPNKREDGSKGKMNKAAENALKRAAAYKEQKKSSSSLPKSGSNLSSFIRQQSYLRGVEIASGKSRQKSSASARDDSPKAGNSIAVDGIENLAAAVERFTEDKSPPGTSNLEEEDQAGRPVPKRSEDPKSKSFEMAAAYKQQQSEMIEALRGEKSSEPAGASEGRVSSSSAASAEDEKVVEIEIVTRDGVIKRKLLNPEEQIRAFSSIKDIKRKGVSTIDFAGLGFADKKKSGRPAGLNDGFDSPPTGAIPEVEILTRDAARFQPEIAEGDQDNQLYKPRVSTWGVFPRPADISKAYGGGRTIRPGDVLETEEEKAVREARSRQLLDDYRKKAGLDVDPRIKLESEQVMTKADSLMDSGFLRDALLLYQLAMRKMPTRSELHGRAALRSGVCLDSLGRYEEAKQVYEILLAHPDRSITKQARRLLFGFQAMEKLKVGGGYEYDASVYRKYFDSFADGYSAYKAEEEETKENLTPYAILLLFPIILVFALATFKGQ